LSGQHTPRAAAVLASTITKVHPGSGRSPGVVDLPVVRDPLGYYFIPGTMLKGTLRKLAEKTWGSDNELVKCIFGPDTNDEDKHAGMLAFHDLYPLLVPAPSDELGAVYVTSCTLIGRAKAILDALRVDGSIKRFVEALAGKCGSVPGSGGLLLASNEGSAGEENIMVGPLELKVKRDSVELDDEILNVLGGLHPLYATVPPRDRIVVLGEGVAVSVLDSLLLRVTRVRLDSKTKTVSSGALWTEEYIPWGVLLVGAVTETGIKTEKCNNISDPIGELGNLVGTGVIVVGGNETVGSGVLRVKLEF